MASAEMSSSEITPAPLTPLPQGVEGRSSISPLSPPQIPLDVDEGIWKKYSSHYEFPLSLLIALGIHIVAILIVIACMTISFQWGRAEIVHGQVVIDEPGAIHEENTLVPPKAGGGSGQRGSDDTNIITPTFDPMKLEVPPDPMAKLDQDTLEIPKLPVPMVQYDKRKKGAPDDGLGDGSKGGIGNEDGSGLPMPRNHRWRIRLSYDEPEVFLGQLADMQVMMAGRLNSGRYLVYPKLTVGGSFQYQQMTEAEFTALVNQSKKLWFINTDRTSTENFAYAVNLSERLLSLVMLIPKELEQAILDAELKHHGLSENEIRQRRLFTSFRIVREGNGWKVSVVK